jgi:hypothetical protein
MVNPQLAERPSCFHRQYEHSVPRTGLDDVALDSNASTPAAIGAKSVDIDGI